MCSKWVAEGRTLVETVRPFLRLCHLPCGKAMPYRRHSFLFGGCAS